MGSIDLPPFLREQMKQKVQSQKPVEQDNSLPPFLKNTNDENKNLPTQNNKGVVSGTIGNGKINFNKFDLNFSLADRKAQLQKELQDIPASNPYAIRAKQEEIYNVDKQLKSLELKQAEKINNSKEIDNAIKNSTDLYFKKNPITLAKPVGGASNSSLYQQKKNQLQSEYDKGNLIIYKNEQGKPLLARPKDKLDNLFAGISDAWNADKESDKVLKMSNKELANYANNIKEDEFLPSKADQSSGYYQVGTALPLVGKGLAAAGTGAVMSEAFPTIAGFSTEGLPALFAWMNTVPDMAKQAQAQSLVANFKRYKAENPNTSDEEAAQKARNMANASYAEALTTGTAMNMIGGNLLPKNSGQGLWKATGQFLKNQPKSVVEMGLLSSGGSFARDLFGATQGYNITDSEAWRNASDAFKSGATLQLAFNAVHGLTGLPKYAKAQANEVLSKVDPQVLRELQEKAVQFGAVTQEQVDAANKNLNEYKAAKEKIIPTGNEEKDAVIAGLVQRKTNLEKAKSVLDKSFHDDIDKHIEEINQRIQIAKNSGEPIRHSEVDDLTGDTNFEPKSYEDLSSTEKKGIVVPKDYGDIEVTEKGEGENKKFIAKAKYLDKEGVIEIYKPIKVEGEFSDKSKAKEAAEQALRQHYYENELADHLKPQKNEKQKEEVIQQQGMEGVGESNERVTSNEISKEQDNVGETSQPTDEEINKNFNENIVTSLPNEPSQENISQGQNQSDANNFKPFDEKSIKEKLSSIDEAEITDPYYKVLHYFSNDGKVHSSAINELFGGKDKRIRQNASTENEKRARISLIGKDAPNIDKLAHKLWESDQTGKYTTQDYKEAIERVLLDYNSKGAMAKDLVEKYDYETAYKKYLSQHGQEFSDIYDNLSDEDINHILSLDADEKRQQELEDYLDNITSQSNIPQDAIREQSPNEMDVRQQTTDGEGMGEGNIQPESITEPRTAEEENIREGEKGQVNIHAEYPPTSLSYQGTGKLETEFPIDERQKTVVKHDIETIKEADDLISKGWNAQQELNKLASGDKTFISDAEYINFTRYAAELSARLRSIKDVTSPEYDKVLSELNKVANIANAAGRVTGRALGIRGRFKTVQDGTYEDFMLNELNANNDAPLTDNQKQTALSDWNKFNEAREKFEKDKQAFDDEVAKFKAEQEAAKLQKGTKKSERKTHEERVAYRKSEIEKAREALKKLRTGESGLSAVPLPGVRELIAIAPHVKNVLLDLLEEGALKLGDAIDKVHEEFKEFGVSKKNIHDIIAGEYNEQKITKKEAAIRMEDLRIEAQLINKLERLQNGEQPKNEKAKIKRNQEIEDLRNKIKDYRKEEAEANKFYGESDSAERRIQALQDELERIKSRKEREPQEKVKRELSDREKSIRDQISKEKQLWSQEKRIKYLEDELTRLQERKPKETKEKAEKEITPREKELKEQIETERKKIREEEREANTFYREEKSPEQKILERIKNRNEKETQRIKEKIAKGDFEPEEKRIPTLENKEFQKQFPQLFKKVQESHDVVIKARHEIALRRAKWMYEHRTDKEKTLEVISKSLNIARTLMTIGDFSAVFRQAAEATVAHPIIASKALKFMFEAAANEKIYNRWLDEVHNSPLWEEAEKSGLPITDPASLRAKEHEEAFQGAQYAEKIPIAGEVVKASERAYNGYLNFIRWEMFKMYADEFTNKGKTFDNNPELYKGISSFIGSSTGRGRAPKVVESASPLLNGLLFASKLMASRLNMLGLTDIPNLIVRGATLGRYGVDFGFYTKLPPEIRVKAMADMAKFVGVGIATLILAKQMGAEVELDPRSSDFGKIRDGNTRWDIWGGFQPYARLISQIYSGQSKSTTTGKIYDLNGEKFGGRTVADQIATFARGKLAPIPATIWDIAARRTLDQQTLDRRFDIPFYSADNPKEGHITFTDEAIKFITPLLINDVMDAWKDRGVSSLYSVLIPSLFGIGVQTYERTPTKQSASRIPSHSSHSIKSHTRKE